MPVWLAKLAPNTTSTSDSFISQLATGVPLRPSTPPPSGWLSAIWPLALHAVRAGAPPAARPPRPGDQVAGGPQRRLGRRDLPVGHPAAGPGGAGVAHRPDLD